MCVRGLRFPLVTRLRDVLKLIRTKPRFFFTADVAFHEMNVIPVLSAFCPFDQSTWQGQLRAGEACLGSISEVPWCWALSVAPGSRGGSSSWHKGAAGDICVLTAAHWGGPWEDAALQGSPATQHPPACSCPQSGLWLQHDHGAPRPGGRTSCGREAVHGLSVSLRHASGPACAVSREVAKSPPCWPCFLPSKASRARSLAFCWHLGPWG